MLQVACNIEYQMNPKFSMCAIGIVFKFGY